MPCLHFSGLNLALPLTEQKGGDLVSAPLQVIESFNSIQRFFFYRKNTIVLVPTADFFFSYENQNVVNWSRLPFFKERFAIHIVLSHRSGFPGEICTLSYAAEISYTLLKSLALIDIPHNRKKKKKLQQSVCVLPKDLTERDRVCPHPNQR